MTHGYKYKTNIKAQRLKQVKALLHPLNCLQIVAVIHSESDIQVLFRWPDMPLGGQECDKVLNFVIEAVPGLLHVSGMCQK